MLFHRCSPARSSSQDLNGFSTGSRQSVHKTWQHLLHCKIILLFLTCADVGWWWRNYAKGLARLASPSLAETNAQLSHLAVLYSGGARKWKKNKQKCAKSVQFHTFFSARFVNGSLQSVNLSMPNILADIIGCKKNKKKKKNYNNNKTSLSIHSGPDEWCCWLINPTETMDSPLFSDVGVSDRAHGWVMTKKTPSTH